jgi:hypothetical protein
MAAVYRSTRAILTVAGRLLPESERTGVADRATTVLEAAERLIETHSDGSVAVITNDPSAIMQTMAAAGWFTRRVGRDTWARGRARGPSRIRLLEPRQAGTRPRVRRRRRGRTRRLPPQRRPHEVCSTPASPGRTRNSSWSTPSPCRRNSEALPPGPARSDQNDRSLLDPLS